MVLSSQRGDQINKPPFSTLKNDLRTLLSIQRLNRRHEPWDVTLVIEGEVDKHDHCPDSEEVLQHGDQLHGGGGEEHREEKHTLD